MISCFQFFIFLFELFRLFKVESPVFYLIISNGWKDNSTNPMVLKFDCLS